MTLAYIQTQCLIHLETPYTPVPHHCPMEQGAPSPSNYPAHVPDGSGGGYLVEPKRPLSQGELGFDQILWMRKVTGAPAARSTMSP